MLNGKQLPEREFVSLRHSKAGKLRAVKLSKGQGGANTKSTTVPSGDLYTDGTVVANHKVNHVFVACKQCGFQVDLTTTDHSGGNESGNGGYGAVTKTAGDAIADLKSDVFTNGTVTRYEGTGDAAVGKNKGCPFCGSKNFV